MDAKEFHRRLDAFYEAGDISGAYAFLRSESSEAKRKGDTAMSLTAANALIGHCRENCLFEEIEGHYREALDCLEKLGLKDSLEEATTRLNAATAYCVMGRVEESEDLFRSAERLYRALLPPGDLTLAAVYNNHGLLYRARNDRKKAETAFREALRILEEGDGAADELAASRLNLASVCGDIDEAEKLTAGAMVYYETPDGRVDIHRFTALAMLAELAFRRGDYREAGERFETTAEDWKRYGGVEKRREILLRNSLFAYEKAGAEDKAEQIRALLSEVEG